MRVASYDSIKMRNQKVRTGKPALAFSIGEVVTEMPYFPDHPCRHPGCPKLVPKGQKYCDEHVGQHPEEVRSAAARGYGSRWRRLSSAFLRAHPLCAACQREGRYVKATRSSSGTKATGNRCASITMMSRHGTRISFLSTTTET